MAVSFEEDGFLTRSWEWVEEHLGLWRVETMFRDWIFPGHRLRNVLFDRYDRVKVREVRPWEYCDPSEMMLYCPFEILRRFVEEETPFDVVEFYGESPMALPDGRIVGDEIKALYRWYFVERPECERRIDVLSEAYFSGFDYHLVFHRPDENGLGKVTVEHDDKKDCHFTDEQRELICDIFPNGIPSREEMFAEIGRMEDELDRSKQEMLHRLIDIRQYLWT